jgi:hypothetical protein
MRRSPHRNKLLLTIALAVAISMPPAALGEGLEACLAEAWPQNQIACLAGIAIEAGNPALCLRSGEPAVRWRCVAGYAEKAGDASPCGILPTGDLDVPGVAEELCRVHLAISWRKPALCMELTTPNLADSCLLQLVRLDGDQALCGRIENESLAAACLEH